MNKKPLIFAALALLFAGSCTKVDESKVPEVIEPEAEQPVGFGAYLNRSVNTKAGYQGSLTTEMLKTLAKGFGVFGYYTNDEPYSASAKPDFMYNQKIEWKDGTNMWEYSPIKYWPNAFGENAQSNVIDRLTFFAYAPYVDVDTASGLVQDDGTENYDIQGITSLSRNTASGDPVVKYTASMDPNKCVDLCWGVAAQNFQSSADGIPTSNDVKAGHPYINLVKPKINDKLQFNFKHALAALNVRIDTDVDAAKHDDPDADGELKDSFTRIYVRAITFEGLTDRGALNLNSKADASVAPLWMNISGYGKPDNTPITVYDGRRDGREGVEGAVASNETPLGLNDVICQNVPYFLENGNVNPDLSAGVTHTPVNVFNGASLDTPILVIPNGQAVKVTVVYDVETIDSKLAKTLSDGKTRGSSIEQAITQSVKLSSGEELFLEAGKKYTLNLHLGMTSVKVTATVSLWDEGNDADVDVPANVPSDNGSFGLSLPGTIDLGNGGGI